MANSKAITPVEQTWPVVEVFGPTVQGEGVDQGAVCHFVRFGGCDFKCSWCDTPDAVLPSEVRKAKRMSPADILLELDLLTGPDPWQPPWVILSGGNPALHDLSSLVDLLHEGGYLVAVETQGSKWRGWMEKVDRLCVSPKPPSSGMVHQGDSLQRFLQAGLEAKTGGGKGYEWMFLKVVVFDDADLDFAEMVRGQLSDSLLYLSAGNDAGRTVGNPTREDGRSYQEVVMDLLRQSRWLVGEVFKRPALSSPTVLIQSQYHVLLWGNKKGV